MDHQIKQHNIQILGQFTQFPFAKKSIQILLSISAFSILFSISPLLPLLSQYIGTFSFQLFSYTSDRNYIFLFCNGILVFLIKNSVADDPNQKPTNPNVVTDHQQSVPDFAEMRELVRDEEIVEIEEDKGRENEILVSEGGEEKKILITQDGNEEEEILITQDGYEEFLLVEEEEEEGMGLLSAEELNKKCDDFIRKMREKIKLEAQKRIMV